MNNNEVPAVELNKEAKIIKTSIDNNASESPQISLDPESNKMSVLGDPNETQPTKGNYKLTFRYPASDISADDRTKMVYDKETDEYVANVAYESRRVKPLYRMRVTLLVSRILSDMGVLSKDGYNSDVVSNKAGEVLVDHIEDIADLARMILNVPKEQVEYMDTEGLAEFFGQLLDNEPNLIKEAVVFLMQSMPLEVTKAILPKNEKQDTQQN